MSTRTLIIGLALSLVACGGGAKSSPAPAAPEDVADAPSSPGAEPAPPKDEGPPPSRDPVELLRIPPKVGEVRVVVETVESDGTMLAAGREVRLARKSELKRTEEVLAVDGDMVTQLKITYDTITDHRTVGTSEQDVVSPLAGKTYVVSFVKPRGKGKPKYTVTEDGKAIKGKPADLVIDDFRDDVGAVGYAGVALGGRTYKVDEPVTVPVAELVSILPEGRSDLTGEGLTITFVERRGEIATFAFTGTLTRPEGTMLTTLTATGTIDVDVPLGRPVKVQLEATTKGTAKPVGKGKAAPKPPAGKEAPPPPELSGTLKSSKTFSAP